MAIHRQTILRLVAIATALFVLIAAIGIGVLHTIDFTIDAKDLEALFARSPYPLTLQTTTAIGRHIHSAAVGNPTRAPVVFIHGTPGSWDNFATIMATSSLLDVAYLISLDRPGFGGSGRGRAEPSLEGQSEAVAGVIEDLAGGRPAILVGHSLGGPIAVRTAADRPDLVSGVILVAPSVDPDLEELWWIQRPADWWFFAWLVPVDLRTCNREILPLESELTELLPAWERIEIPVTVIHGEADRLVPAENAEFVQRMATRARVEIALVSGVDHFIPWSHPDLIIDAVIKMSAKAARSEDHQTHPDI